MSTTHSQIYGAPPQESLVLTDVGNLNVFNQGSLDFKTPLGLQQSIPMNASLSSGVQKYQYNKFYWNKEFFTFNYFNCCIGVAIACYNNALETLYFAIYPIFLPRVCMTFLQSAGSDGKISPAVHEQMVRQLVYYLNIGWTGYGNILKPLGAGSIPGTSYSTPFFYAQDCKGNFVDLVHPISGCPFMPVIADSPDNPIPPLLWDVGPNLELVLRYNTDCLVTPVQQEILLGFSLISIRDYMSSAPFIFIKGFAAPDPITVPGSLGTGSMFLNTNTGWCGQGAYATGMGQFDDINNQGGYNDGYTDLEREELFAATYLPGFQPRPATASDFYNLCSQFRLVQGASACIIARRLTSLLPSRFYTVASEALTRNTQRSVLSNNNNIHKATIGVEYYTLDNTRAWQDATIGSNVSSSGNNPVNKMNPMHSVQSIDLKMFDEWGNFLDSFNRCIYPKSVLGGFWNPSGPIIDSIVTETFQYDSLLMENDASNGGPIPLANLPAWVLALNPNPLATNGESLLINSHWNANIYPFFYYKTNPGYSLALVVTGTIVGSNNLVPDTVNPATSISSTVTHFGRLLGT